jgi:hypothetical protein
MRYTSRKLHIPQPYLLDTMIRGRILNGCWLLAAAGISIAQMRLLAQAWQQDQHAAPTACVVSAWLIGALIGGIVNNALRRYSAPPAIVWGVAFLASALAWRTWTPAVGHSSVPQLMPGLAEGILMLMGMALLLGLFSALWLGQQRSWAAVGERAPLFRNAACPTFGLVIVWCYPNGSDLLGLACLLPLLSLDLFTPSFAPRIPWSGMTGTLLAQRADPARWLPLRLERPARMAGWWRTFLVHRGYAVHTLLASGTAILLGGLWSALPTAFAGGLAQTGQLNKLIALLAGQIAALAVGTLLLNNSRSLVGVPDRLIPPPLQTHAWRLAWLSLVGLAFGLVLLGLPLLQAPFWLGVSAWIYTLALTTWGILLPRLRPSITSKVFAQRHLAFAQGRVMRSGYLAYEQALENRANLVLSTGEGLMTAICAPAVGLLIDHIAGGRTLIFIGLALAWFLAAVLVANPARIAGQLFAGPATARATLIDETVSEAA